MLSIDEAIEDLKYDIEIDMYIHDIAPQIAEWLEELKGYRDKNKMIVRIDVKNMDSIKDKIEELSKYAEIQYNKALDDFVKFASDMPTVEEEDGTIRPMRLEEMAEQLKEIAEEYNGGWIACSERLPEIGQEVIVTTKNGSVYSNIYYDYIDNNAKEPCFHRWDDEMWNCFMLDVIAWQPLPKPFKERD